MACNIEGNGDGVKRDGNKGDRGATATWVMAMAKATTWVMVKATRLAGDKEGKGEGRGSKGDGDGNEGGGQRRGQWQLRQEQWRRRQGWQTSNDNGHKEGDCDGN
jgi:hypothetical protein